jgi:asparagine synthetase B (glutamine-hydrolysing)
MCSFLFARTRSRIDEDALERSNFHARFRGPDLTTTRHETGPDGWCLTYLHNLLDISGCTCAQPVCEGGEGERLRAIFNGEIYNFRRLAEVESDTQCLLPLYKRRGSAMGQDLDGEFSIAIYDETKNSAFVFTDPFLTKPLYFGRGREPGDFGVATCRSSLVGLGFDDVRMADPNSAYAIRFSSASIAPERQFPLFEFDLRQHKNSYTDWQKAFVEAVRKRASHGVHQPAVFLSSGYDSGGICVALNDLNIPYDTFSIVAGEEPRIVGERIGINRHHSCRQAYRYRGISRRSRERLATDIRTNVENFRYSHEDGPGVVTALHDDHGAVGANFISAEARRHRCLVNLSGSGADEILSDYGCNGEKIYYHSQFGGRFPDDLHGFFPWNKFYGDTQRSYLFKDEFILGRHGVEGRYPYLDKQVVQEFLWLSPELKNHAYKAPLAGLLQAHGYPFEEGIKRGFSPDNSPSAARSFLGRVARRLATRARW